jgi:hypothetical protein
LAASAYRAWTRRTTLKFPTLVPMLLSDRCSNIARTGHDFRV